MANKQKITPYLWYDKEAREAAQLYTEAFSSALEGGRASRIKSMATLHNTPSGDCDIPTIELWGYELTLISAGPYFKFTPAISLLVACGTREQVDHLWARLSEGGKVLMELGEYPFSPRYGWTQDRYGLSWQLSLSREAARPGITPSLLFVGPQCGKAEDAIRFYTSVFPSSRVGDIQRHGPGQEPDRPGTVKYADFTLHDQGFAAMDSAHGHDFAFSEAFSLMVHCDTQKEIDTYWGKLSSDPQSEQCGWLKDRYGVSWQITPSVLDRMLQDPDAKKVERVTQAFLQMKKFDLAALERAYEGR
jgi:predicted 3-demethylubiquinone-9 3-methyltransferase (glyoxalase superfamily)